MTTTTTDHGLTVGDLLVSTWGYDQTNVDFYEVTRATAKMVQLRPVSIEQEPGESWGTFTAAPRRGAFTGPEFRCKVKGNPENPYVNINSFAMAQKWNGTDTRGSNYA